MKKTILVPVYFKSGRDNDYNKQLEAIKALLVDEAEVLEPVALGAQMPEKADAIVFPQVLGDAYKQVEDFKKLELPLLLVTSEFGTVSMWDWEIASFLRTKGVNTIAPYNLDQTKKLCRSLSVKKELKGSKFLVFQDNPGEGFQPEIFKRFYWWEDECTELMHKKFGVEIVKKSFKELAQKAKNVPCNQVKDVLEKRNISTGCCLSEKPLSSAIQMYVALKNELDQDSSIKGMGTNCLNESHFSDTTPCLAWSMLYEETGIMWACEADTMSLITEYILNKSLNAPIMMTNIYPFLMGMAALKHEKIPHFPEVDSEPENHLLLAHCGYFGLVPQKFSCEWSLKPKILGIVDENSHVIDAQMKIGPVTLTKIGASMDKIMVVHGHLEKYAQFSNSDCLNGAVVKISSGDRLMNRLYSHHLCFMPEHRQVDIELVAKIFGFDVEVI
jgi:hypothetical protein